MYLMANSVAGTREPYPMLFGNRAYKAVVVRVFKAALQRVVIYVCYRALGLYPVHAHSLKLKIRHCSCRVLRQGLINFQSDFRSLYHLSVDDMLFNDLLG